MKQWRDQLILLFITKIQQPVSHRQNLPHKLVEIFNLKIERLILPKFLEIPCIKIGLFKSIIIDNFPD